MTEITAQAVPPCMTVRVFVEKNRALLCLNADSSQAGLDRLIARKRLQKLGMALAGFTGYLQPGRIYVFGRTELAYFNSQTPEQQDRILGDLVPPGEAHTPQPSVDASSGCAARCAARNSSGVTPRE
mgnify:CR=1 FL=1